jgi:hypothetical protein
MPNCIWKKNDVVVNEFGMHVALKKNDKRPSASYEKRSRAENLHVFPECHQT